MSVIKERVGMVTGGDQLLVEGQIRPCLLGAGAGPRSRRSFARHG